MIHPCIICLLYSQIAAWDEVVRLIGWVSFVLNVSVDSGGQHPLQSSIQASNDHVSYAWVEMLLCICQVSFPHVLYSALCRREASRFFLFLFVYPPYCALFRFLACARGITFMLISLWTMKPFWCETSHHSMIIFKRIAWACGMWLDLKWDIRWCCLALFISVFACPWDTGLVVPNLRWIGICTHHT